MFFKKHFPRILIVLADLLILPGLLFCKQLSEHMMSTGKPCSWLLVGAQCGTCGGTRCVRAFLSGQLWDSFLFNPIIFTLIVVAIVTVLLLNRWLLCRLSFAKKALKKIYGLVPFLSLMGAWVVFTLLRNIPFFIKITKLLITYIN